MITLLEIHILLKSPIWNVWVFPNFSYRKTRECPLFLESTLVACLGITSLSRKWWKERTTCKGGMERRSKYSTQVRNRVGSQSFSASYGIEDGVLFCEFMGHCPPSTFPFFSKEGSSKPVPCWAHIRCCSL